MTDTEIDKEYLGKVLLDKGFETWFRYLFRVINNRPFTVEPIHHDLFQIFQDIYDGKQTRVNICLPPRSGKTTLNMWFLVYCITINPRCNFIYTSFNQSLLSDISRDIMNILEHPIYKAMYPSGSRMEKVESTPVDNFWREYLEKENKTNVYSNRKIVTAQGGVLLFAAIGSAITGFGAGQRGIKGFSGALQCFPYEQKIMTEQGYLEIGKIVEGKKDLKIFSKNIKTGKIELQKIDKYIKNINDNRECVEISFSNGLKIKCTSDHKVWTKNRGYVEAKDLTNIDRVDSCFPQTFNLVNGKPIFLAKIISPIVLIKNVFENTFTKNGLLPRMINHIISTKILKRFPLLYCQNSSFIRVEFFSNRTQRPFGTSNSNYIFTRKITSGKNKSSKIDSILHIFRFSSVSKIFKPIVCRNAVQMPYFHSVRSRTNKRNHYKLMNSKQFNFSIFGKIHSKISSTVIRWAKDLFFDFYNSPGRTKSSKCSSRTAYHFSKVRNFIHSLVTRNVFVDDVRFVCHIQNSFCISVHNNHNIYVGESQAVLCSNCDDPNKPADIHSQTMRDKVLRYYVETLLSRLNDSNIPIVNTQQRLHLEDLAGHLITKYNFYTLRKPLLDHNGVCQLPSQYTPERIKELQFDDSMFQAQYQQEPTAEKGLLIKRDWWKLYNPEEEKCTGQVIITADTAFKESKTADFSCIQVWELRRDKMLMRDMVVDRWEFPELIEMAKQMWNKWTSDSVHNQAKYFFIEDKASGTPLQQTLVREGITAIAWTPKEYEYPDNKVERAKTFSWDVFCGKVYLPKGNRMSEYLINESALFAEDGSSLHDDSLDSADMSHSVWKYYGGGQ